MREHYGNIMEFIDIVDAICITTNGFIKSNGESVMGRGIALQMKQRYPDLPLLVGKSNKKRKNCEVLKQVRGTSLVSFLVKPASEIYYDEEQVVRSMKGKLRPGQSIPGWACKASLPIIKASAVQLVELANEHDWTDVLLPRPGCGAGELRWESVGVELSRILDDRFTCMTYSRGY